MLITVIKGLDLFVRVPACSLGGKKKSVITGTHCTRSAWQLCVAHEHVTLARFELQTHVGVLAARARAGHGSTRCHLNSPGGRSQGERCRRDDGSAHTRCPRRIGTGSKEQSALEVETREIKVHSWY